MKKTILFLSLLVMPVGPPKENSKGARTTANEALDSVEHGLKEAAGGAKEGANKALEAVDKTIHKAVQ